MTFAAPIVLKQGPWVVGGSSTFSLFGIESSNINPNINPNVKVQSLTAAGNITRSFVYFNTAEPMATASTTDLQTVLAGGVTPVLGLPGTSGTPAISTLTVYGAQCSNLGTITSGSTHFSTVINCGLLTIRSIKATQGGKATAQLEAHAIWNGTNDPFVYAENAALPVGVITQEFTLGPVYINGTELVGVKDVSVDMGLRETKIQSDGNLFPTMIYTSEWNPRITVTVTDAEVLADYSLYGTAGSSSNTAVYLAACENMASRYAANTDNHIKIGVPASQSYIHPESARLQAETGEGIIVIEPILGYSSGYIQPLNFETGVTIGS
jgi:hypothetical protein